MSEPAQTPEVIVAYDGVCTAMYALIAGIKTEQWSGPTPCTDWDVRALVNHVVAGTLVFVANIRGTRHARPRPGPSGRRRRRVLHVGRAGAARRRGRARPDRSRTSSRAVTTLPRSTGWLRTSAGPSR